MSDRKSGATQGRIKTLKPRADGFAEDAASERFDAVPPLDAILQREYRNAAGGKGADPAILDELATHGFSSAELFALVVPRRTLARRRGTGVRLSKEESDRAVRLARITAVAERIFGDPRKAHRWLRKPSRTLDGVTPISLLKSETGSQLVEQTLYRIEYGMLA
ncbi:MAG: type II RES/Xre toxin-antitoxin system antitoxin [Propylenella sp.]